MVELLIVFKERC